MKKDKVMRAITEDGAFRIIVARTTQLVSEAIRLQEVTGETADLFGSLLTGTILTRETMAPSLRVQAFLMQENVGTLAGDSYPGGKTRGLVSLNQKKSPHFPLSNNAILRVTRALPNHELHEGIVSANSDFGISGSFVTYMMQSEQVESTVGLSTIIKNDKVIAAGGFIVQLLPEASTKSVAQMAHHLEQYYDPKELIKETNGEPKAMIKKLLLDIPFVILEESPLQFGCVCSKLRVLSAISALDRAEIKDMIDKKESIETVCDYCKTKYQIGPHQLQSLLAKPS